MISLPLTIYMSLTLLIRSFRFVERERIPLLVPMRSSAEFNRPIGAVASAQPTWEHADALFKLTVVHCVVVSDAYRTCSFIVQEDHAVGGSRCWFCSGIFISFQIEVSNLLQMNCYDKQLSVQRYDTQRATNHSVVRPPEVCWSSLENGSRKIKFRKSKKKMNMKYKWRVDEALSMMWTAMMVMMMSGTMFLRV